MAVWMSRDGDWAIHSPRLSFSEPPTIPQWKRLPNPGASEHGLWVRHHYSYDFPVKFKGQLPKVDEALSRDFFIVSVRIDLVLSDKGLGQNRCCCLKAAANSPHLILPPSPLSVNISSASRCNLALLFLMLTLHVTLKIMYFNLPHFKTDPGLFSLNSRPEACVIPGWTCKCGLSRTSFARRQKRCTAGKLPVWPVLSWNLPAPSEITSNSLFWVKLLGGLVLNIVREPRRVEWSLLGGQKTCVRIMTWRVNLLQTKPFVFSGL